MGLSDTMSTWSIKAIVIGLWTILFGFLIINADSMWKMLGLLLIWAIVTLFALFGGDYTDEGT